MRLSTKRVFVLFLIYGLCQWSINAQPTANFTTNKTDGCVPLLVQYQNQSTGGIVSYSWNLGTTSSGLSNPVQLYTTGGIYTICLTVTDTAGLTDTHCKTNYINAFALPDAGFGAVPPIGCNPASIQFTDTSSSASGAAMASWQWSFGDGGSSNSQHPTHIYTQNNSFDVTLNVVDANGCSGSTTRTNYITVVDPPQAAFIATNIGNCTVPHTVNFSNTTPITSTLSFLWNFGDGSTSAASSPSHTYNNSGIYTVSLTVTDIITGCSDVFTQNNLVDLTSKLSFSYSAQSACGPTPINFNDNSSGTTSNWIWDFGNGDSAFVKNPVYTYTTPGCYFVSLTATDGDGCTSTISDTTCINIYPIPTVSYASSGNLEGCELPHTASFSGGSSGAAQWAWDFGDGNTDSIQNPTHEYTSFGIFPVSLTVTSPDGCTNSTIIDTFRIEPITANFIVNNTQGCSPITATFQDLSTSFIPINSWQWDFGFTTSTQQNPTVVFNDTGTYDIQLIVGNIQGCFDTIVYNDLIQVGMPANLSFVASNNTLCIYDSVLYNNTSDHYPQLWSWDFGDSTYSSIKSPYLYYRDTGFFDITLTATHYNCPSTITYTDYVQVFPPKASYVDTIVCDDPYTVNFTDYSISASTYSWDFGVPNSNTDTSSLPSPSFTYPERGDYLVTLTVTNGSSGCTNSGARYVYIRDPKAIFTVAEDTICADVPLTISNNSLGADHYAWSALNANITSGNSANTTLSYSQGFYDNIQLIVTDVNGCRDTMIVSDTIAVSDVAPIFTPDVTDGCIPLTVNFTESSTTFLGTLTNWDWNFGGSTGTSTDQNPTFIYNNKGTYTPTLQVTNSLGCNRTVSGNTIRATFPTIGFSVDSVACTSDSLSFNNNSSGISLTYLWDFGDGTTSTERNPTHRYMTEDTFNVCLTVTDVNGCDTTLCKIDEIIIADPFAAFTADTTYGGCGTATITFQDTSINATSIKWLFSDGTTSTLTNPVKTFSTGSYDVCLVVYGASGCTDTICKTDYILVQEPLADFSFTPNSGCPPLDVVFTATGIGVERFIWVTGDGGLVVQPGTRGADTIQLTYPYQHGGTYIPVLIAESDSGCQDINISPNFIDVEVFEVEIEASDTVLCDNGTITFTSLLTSPLPIDTINWTFSGGSITSSNDSIVDVTFSSVGTYTVTLFAGNGTCSRSTTRTIVVVPSPVSSFSYSPTLLCTPAELACTNTTSITQGNITSQLWDFGTYGTDTSFNASINVTSTDTIPVSLISISDFGCADTFTNTIVINETPIANAGPDFVVCRGEIATLNASGNGSYLWSPSSAVSCDTCTNPIVIINASTDYTLVVTSPAGCKDTATVHVDLSTFSTPIISVGNDTTICKGDTIQLYVSGGTNVLAYDWDTSRSGLSCYIGCSNPFAAPTVTTTYPVVLTGDGGCQSRDSITVTVIEDTASIAGIDQTICEGDTAQLQTTMGINPIWTPFNGGLSCVYCPDPLAFPTQTTDYAVTVITNNGCTVTDSLRINVIPKSSISAGEDLTLCANGSVMLNGSGTGAPSWNNGTTLDNSLTFTPNATPTQTTEYILSVNTNSCTLTDTMTVFVVSSAQVSGDDIEICAGDTIPMNIDGFAQSYTWSPTTGLSDPNAQNPTIVLDETTTYTILAEIPNCPSASTDITITVNQVPEINGFPIQQVPVGGTVSLALEIQANPTYDYQWFPTTEITCSECPNPKIIGNPGTDGITYYVTVTDFKGCSTTDSIQIELIDDCDDNFIVVPTGFTPDNDGLNDVLYVRGSSIQDIQTFNVYSRSGTLVFSTSNKADGWDGTYNGRKANTGVYVYYVEAICPVTGNLVRKQGNVLLLAGERD